MFRATNSPILRSTSRLYVQLLVQCLPLLPTGVISTAAEAVPCTKVVYTVKKSAPEDGRICRPKHVGLI